MPRKKTVAPFTCLPLIEEAVGTPARSTEAFRLPASFPAHALDDDQLDEVATWFDAWITDMLHLLRQGLLRGHTFSKTPGHLPPATLQNLIIHAVVLSHLLRLHPAAEPSLPELAKHLGVAQRRLYYARDAIMATLGGAALAALRGQRQPQQQPVAQYLADQRTLDHSRAMRRSTTGWLVPFLPGTGVAARFATVQRIAGHFAVARVREELVPGTHQNAILVHFKNA